jgi:DNA polymerase
MLGMVSGGQRLRGQFQFLGAARTGRWSGRGIQPQNLPRVPKGFSPEAFIRTAQAGNGLDVVAPAPVLDCVSWSLRACLGEDGTPLWSFDFSQIEARVIAWLAGQEDVLEVFRDPSQDVYVWTAQQVGSDNRQLGKVLVLALGFGMGAAKLRSTAWENYGVRMTEAEAERFKREWRARNPRIVGFWYECEGAARDAILHPGRVYPVLPSAITFTATARTLQMRLPSGRVLYYHKPHVGTGGEITYWGEEKGAWKQRRTWGGTLAENATQAAARDIMAEAMSRVATCRGLSPLMTVHDELVYAAEDTEQLKSLMLEAPSWSGGLPIDGEAKMMTRYSVVTK